MKNRPLRLTLLALCAALALSGCGPTGDWSYSDPKEVRTEANDYRGNDLRCVKTGAAESRTLSCDFDAFYAEHPDLLVEAASTGEASDDIHWVEYDNAKLPCFREGFSKNLVMSCDFVWFNTMNAERLD
jgi:ABC-type enterochelin transport system substrate-binding protein